MKILACLIMIAITAFGFYGCKKPAEDTIDPGVILEIPDANFKNYLTSTNIFVPDSTNSDVLFPWLDSGKPIDANGDGEISETEALEVVWIDCSGRDIANLEGIEHFTNLTYLNCQKNQLTTLDVSGCTKLFFLECSENQLTTLDVSGCVALKELFCFKNQLTTLDVSKCIMLEILSCSYNQLTSFDASECTAMKELYCVANGLTTLDVSKVTELEYLSCFGNQLATLDVSECTALERLYCNPMDDESGNNLLKTLFVNTAQDRTGWEVPAETKVEVK